MSTDRSKICDLIEFKLRCIQHFKKVYQEKSRSIYPITELMMVEQTKRLDDDIICMIDGDRKLNTFAQKLKDLYDLAGWLHMTRNHR
jgi:hypothetical protein